MTTHLALELRSYATEARKHHHDHHQLVLPVAGSLELTIGGQGGEVSASKAAVIPAGQDHGFAAGGHNQFLVADVPEALSPALERLPLFLDLDPALAHYVAFLNHQLQTGNSSLHTQRQMLMLLIQLMEERHGEALQLDRRVALARSYLDERYRHPVSMAELTSVCHLSHRQLNELFRRQVGMSPQNYLTERRMQQAWHLLESTALSIQQVAERVGYTSAAAFSDRFRKHFGHAPSHFRRSGK